MQFLSILVYRLLLLLCFPLILYLTLRDARRRQGGIPFLLQRFGFAYPVAAKAQPLWLHVASLGEVNAAKPLIKWLYDHYPGHAIVATTTTPTGFRALKALPWPVEVAYLPIDYVYAIRRFLRCYQPQRLVVLETELWPNLFSVSRRWGCSLHIVNARLSVKTLKQRWLYPLFRYCIRCCEQILTRSDQEYQHFIGLGADRSQLHSVGNIKFSACTDLTVTRDPPFLRDYILAASTHADEEYQICTHLLPRTKTLLVIVPRHPERLNSILSALADAALRIAVRSAGDQVDANTQVYIADTVGELPDFMAHARLVFMGGSLVPHGGQNILEAAALGAPIVCGPYMHNFDDEVETLKDGRAIVQVNSIIELVEHILQWLAQPEVAVGYGQRAKALINTNMDIAARYGGFLAKHWGL